jgi:SAM-dependent methyltransferase
MQALNESLYQEEGEPYDDSPHLKHRSIHTALLERLHEAIEDVCRQGLPPTLLDIGAGVGPFVEPALAAGCSVTATDMAPTAVEKLQARYRRNPSFTGILDAAGDLSAVADDFSIILYASVLHHIPDYIGALENALQHLAPGGALLTFQDPLWYSTMRRGEHLLHTGAYLAWRATQRQNYISGIRSRLRRATGHLDLSNPSDMVEYHVVRKGVNQHQIADILGPRFRSLTVVPYWSTLSRSAQYVGERLGLESDFAIVALGYRAQPVRRD